MVRGAERARGEQPACVQARDAVDPRDLDCLGAAHRRQDRRQPPREHRFARPRGTLEQHVVAAGGRDLQRHDCDRVSSYLGEVGLGDAADRWRRSRKRRQLSTADDVCRVDEARGGGDLDALDERRLAGALARDDQPCQTCAPRSLGHRERARAVAQLAAERQLSEHRVGAQRRRRHLAARGQHGQRQGRVEPWPDLAQERRREICRDPRLRELEARVQNRGTNPLPRFPHRGVP